MRNGMITQPDGTQKWYKDDKLHREDDLPAVIQACGGQFWWKHGKWHRENGPAEIYAPDDIRWCLDGEVISFDEWCVELYKSPKEKAMLMLKYF